MKETPERSQTKRRWRMRKRKKDFFLLKKETILSFSFRQCPSNRQHHFAVWCFGHHATSQDVALVSPFTQINKGKYRRNVFASYLFSYLFFLYISFGLSLDKALHRPVNVGWNSVTKIWSQISYGNTALPLAPDLQKTSNPTSSNPGRRCLHFTYRLYHGREDWALLPWNGNRSRKRKTLNSNLWNPALKLTLCHILLVQLFLDQVRLKKNAVKISRW